MRPLSCLCALLLLLGGCSDDAAQIAASPTPGSGFRSEPVDWSLRSVIDDGRSLRIEYLMSGVASDCEREGRATVAEGPNRVLVIAHKLVTLDRQRACTEEAAFIEETVALKTKLGTRKLIGCRPGQTDDAEDATCRDLKRGSPSEPVS